MSSSVDTTITLIEAVKKIEIKKNKLINVIALFLCVNNDKISRETKPTKIITEELFFPKVSDSIKLNVTPSKTTK